MNRFLGLIGILALLVTSVAFAYLNSGHRVTLRLGVVTLYSVPLTVVVFGSVIVGMVVMLVAGIRSDLKVRRILRARLAEEDREERERFVDLSQQDLFAQAEAEGAGRAAGPRRVLAPGEGNEPPTEGTDGLRERDARARLDDEHGSDVV